MFSLQDLLGQEQGTQAVEQISRTALGIRRLSPSCNPYLECHRVAAWIFLSGFQSVPASFVFRLVCRHGRLATLAEPCGSDLERRLAKKSAAHALTPGLPL